MAHRIEVLTKKGHRDALGAKTAARIREDLGLPVEDILVAQVYSTDLDLSAGDLEKLATGPFCDPIVQEAFVDRPGAVERKFDWLIEVGYLPGVTDNVGRTAYDSAQVILGRKWDDSQGFYAATQYLIQGTLRREQVESIAGDLLANRLIQRWTILQQDELDPSKGLPPNLPLVARTPRPPVESVDLSLDDEALTALSRTRTLALNLEEMRTIRDHFSDEARGAVRKKMGLPEMRPTDVELETLAQTWSEHCKHKIFAARINYESDGETERIDGLFPTYIQGATRKIRQEKGDRDLCQSVFVDNAGVIRFNEEWSLVMKVETHNSPSALDPYGGALTGIVGVNRDPFGTGMGARLIFNTDVFCFATPFWSASLPPRLLHPKRVLKGVREGVEHGGNKSGIPTINGSVVFDDRFAGKPLVFCGTGALLPARLHGKPGWEKGARAQDRVVMVGGRIGADGIHGATFSSEQLHEDSPATAVQIGDPITQKRMTDFLLKARDAGLYRSITDNGAGGLASSVGEMARDCGGCRIYLDRAPLKYPGLAPWMILLSESQERMTLAVAPEQVEEFCRMAQSMNVEATDIGDFTDTGDFHILFGDQVVALLPMSFLHEGVPTMELVARWEPPEFVAPASVKVGDWGEIMKGMMGRLNICSKEYFVRQYDHEVQGGSVIKPLVGKDDDGPSDAAVWRPLLDSMEAVVVSHGLCPRYSDIDTYHMAAAAVDEAVRNAVAVGGDPDAMAGLDNFCWCDPLPGPRNPDAAFKLAQLVRANKGLYDATVAYGVPCISGKDSMKNDYVVGDDKISIPPTLLFTVVGKIEDAGCCVTMDAKSPGDALYILGLTRAELGGSEYLAQINAQDINVPRVRFDENLSLYRKLHRAIRGGLVRSCHDCSDGGLAVALAEVGFSGGLGLRVALESVPTPPAGERPLSYEELLFSESAGRFVVTVSPGRKEDFENVLSGTSFALVGEVTREEILELVAYDGERLCRLDMDDLKAAWKKTLDF